MMQRIQVKIRLTENNNRLLKDYCLFSDSTQSQVISKALRALFRKDREFSSKHGLRKDDTYQLISVADIEDFIFEKYKTVIYIHAAQDEMIGIKLDYWPKCMSNYTILDFKEKILRKCLAKEVDISVLNHESEQPHQRTLIKTIRSGFTDNGLAFDQSTYQEIWENFTP
ncbi:MAG: hypothetical protein ACWA5U_04785 [bacterium]